jgi:hypothetical protein
MGLQFNTIALIQTLILTLILILTPKPQSFKLQIVCGGECPTLGYIPASPQRCFKNFSIVLYVLHGIYSEEERTFISF